MPFTAPVPCRHLLLPAALSLALLSACGSDQGSAPRNSGPKKVAVYTVAPATVPVTTELAGRVAALNVAEIRPQVGGILQQRLFTEGQQVKAGQVLYQIDSATYQAAYNSAQAAVVKAEATLKSAELTASRNASLARIDAISQQTADDSQATAAEDRAALEVAKAALETARINLEHTRITAPISGRVDLSAVTPGALLTASQTTALTTVRQLDPLVVDIKQSSTDLLQLRAELRAGTQRKVGMQVPVQLILEDGSTYAHTGMLKFDGVSVDESTGMITLRATVPNPEGTLLPGMYVRAQVTAGTLPNALLVPQESVSRNASGGATALVVDNAGQIAERKLTLGRAIGNRWLVTAGLKAGEKLVVEGQKKVAIGDLVTPVPFAASATAAK